MAQNRCVYAELMDEMDGVPVLGVSPLIYKLSD
jgi:hypothetical protein